MQDRSKEQTVNNELEKYLSEKTAHVISGMKYHLNPNLTLDEVATFYIHIPCNMRSIRGTGAPFNFDILDYLKMLSFCKSRYVHVFSDPNKALQYREPTVDQTFFPNVLDMLQSGYFWLEGYKVPKLFPNFVVYQVSGLTTREFIAEDISNLTPYLKSCTTETLDTLSAVRREVLIRLENNYREAEGKFWEIAHSPKGRDTTDLRKKYSEAEDVLVKFIVGMGKKMTPEEFEKTKGNAFVTHTYPDKAKEECPQLLEQKSNNAQSTSQDIKSKSPTVFDKFFSLFHKSAPVTARSHSGLSNTELSGREAYSKETQPVVKKFGSGS